MLPLIPALILLLLQGPSAPDKRACDRVLLSDLEAVHLKAPERKALEQLIASSSDAKLAEVIAQLIAWTSAGQESEAPATLAKTASPVVGAVGWVAKVGFYEGQRTRDGPTR